MYCNICGNMNGPCRCGIVDGSGNLAPVDKSTFVPALPTVVVRGPGQFGGSWQWAII